MASLAVAVREVTAQLEAPDFRAQLAAALPDNVSVDKFVRVTRTAIVQNPDLVNADRGSLFLAVNKCAADGLMPDGRQAALVIFGGKAQYMPMVGGLRKKAAEHGISLEAHVVYANDEFEYELGWEPRVTHKPAPLGQDRGAPLGAYAVARDQDGNRYLEVMSAAEIEQVRSVSRAKDSGPWKSWPTEMWRKTVARRLWKTLPFADRQDTLTRFLDSTDTDADLDVGAAGPRVLSAPAMTVDADAAFEEDSGASETVTSPADSGAHDGEQGDAPEQALFQPPSPEVEQRRAANRRRKETAE